MFADWAQLADGHFLPPLTVASQPYARSTVGYERRLRLRGRRKRTPQHRTCPQETVAALLTPLSLCLSCILCVGLVQAEQQAQCVYAECTAPVNIAVIKYWGKRDEELILPVNSSLSVTLDQAELRTRTLVVAVPPECWSNATDAQDAMWLNGQPEEMNGARLQNCIRAIRARAAPQFASWKLRVWTENNFPTAAGLASSASGLACFAYTLAQAFQVQESRPGELSVIARLGSGSACRSMYGGYVKWEMGSRSDGEDSIAVQVAPESHWPEMHAILLVASDKKKGTSSTSGMKTSVDTSDFLRHRWENIVPGRMQEMETAILERNFAKFAEITMKDSNQFHSVCLDTYPPIFYMNDSSRQVISLVHLYNAAVGETRIAYTFDAGPNAVLYVLKEHVPEVLSFLMYFFPPADGQPLEEYVPQMSYLESIGLNSDEKVAAHTLPQALQDALPAKVVAQRNPDSIRYMMITRVGPGPQTLCSSSSS